MGDNSAARLVVSRNKCRNGHSYTVKHFRFALFVTIPESECVDVEGAVRIAIPLLVDQFNKLVATVEEMSYERHIARTDSNGVREAQYNGENAGNKVGEALLPWCKMVVTQDYAAK